MPLDYFFCGFYEQTKPTLIWVFVFVREDSIHWGDVDPILLGPMVDESFSNRGVLLVSQNDFLPGKLMALRHKSATLMAFLVDKCCRKLRFLKEFC